MSVVQTGYTGRDEIKLDHLSLHCYGRLGRMATQGQLHIPKQGPKLQTICQVFPSSVSTNGRTAKKGQEGGRSDKVNLVHS